jgi:hypothetical protein
VKHEHKVAYLKLRAKESSLRMRDRKMTYPAGDVSLDLVGKGVGEQEAVHPQAQQQERHYLLRMRDCM